MIEPPAASARTWLARLHVGMTARESRAHALNMADAIEQQLAVAIELLDQVAGLRSTLDRLVAAGRAAEDLLNLA